MKTTQDKWNELSRQGVLCSQPKLDLTPEEAIQYLNRFGHYTEDLGGKKVLCLASGGGQQSIAFALLGADVTVVDFSTEQLKKDRFVSEKYDLPMRIVQADMQDLSDFEEQEFDIVYQPYSINYIPSTERLFDEVSRVLKPGGLYDLMFHNPYVHGSWKNGCWESAWTPEELWRGKGYPIWQPYRDGQAVTTLDPHWRFTNSEGEDMHLSSPQEYRHTTSTILNGLIQRGMDILHYQEEVGNGYDHPPGSWEHYTSCLPPWIYLLTRKR
ncbi:MAG: class I SAM-dependent methyltransferase [Bacteroidota bacterium]